MSVARLALVAALCTAAVSAATAQGMSYAANWNTAKAQAAKQNKLVLIEFWTTWCGYCKQMRASTLIDKNVVAKSKGLVPLRMNAEAEGKDLAKKYDVSSYPAYIFVDSQGTVFGRMQGASGPTDFQKGMSQSMQRYKDFTTLTAKVKKNPKDGESFAGLAVINGARGSVEVAEAQAKKAESVGYKGPKLAAAWVSIGEGARTRNRLPGAIAYYQKSLKYPGTPKDVSYAHYGIAVLSGQLGRKSDALKHVRLALNTKGAPKDVINAAKELQAFLTR